MSLLSYVSSATRSRWFGVTATLTLPLVVSAITLFLRRITNNGNRSVVKKQNTRFRIIADDNSMGSLAETPMTPISWNSLGLEQPLVIAMVGLPARGKSYIVKMIIRYLKWTGFECQNFNVGSYRRKIGLASADSSFFSAGNSDAKKVREEMAMAVQEEMYAWLHEERASKRRVAIFDATNTTKDRRLSLAQKARKENCFLLFVESICNDKNVLQKNYEMKLNNDDYINCDPKQAMKDFLDRVAAYEKVYEEIEDDEDNFNIAYIKLINVGQKMVTRNCTGYLPSQVAFYLQNVHIGQRKIYLSLNSENMDLVEEAGRLGGAESGKLTEAGRQYSLDLAKFIQSQQETVLQDLGREILVLAGTARIHAETVLHLRMLYSCYNTPLLNELRGGDLHGMTKDEIERNFPQEHMKRVQDKLNYRYPGVGGESYMDVIERVRPVIIELERQRRSVVLVCHLAVLRCIYGKSYHPSWCLLTGFVDALTLFHACTVMYI